MILHILWIALHMHQHIWNSQRGNGRNEIRIYPSRTHIVDHMCTCRYSFPGYAGEETVNGKDLFRKSFANRFHSWKYPVQLVFFSNTLAAWPGALSAYIQNSGSLNNHFLGPQ